jgi:hypothetical protein
MTPELDRKLFDRFDFYKPDEPVTENLMGFGFECGDGWFNLIWEMSLKIEKELKRQEEGKFTKTKRALRDEIPFKIVQVKEKFATLSVYPNFASEEIFNIIDEYEKKSAEVCEDCGKPGEVRNLGWIRTLCEKCYTKAEYKS